MNAAYAHLVLNHLPPILGIAAIIVIVCGALWRSDAVRRAGVVLVVAAAVAAVPTFYSGENAEEIVKKLDGVNAAAIEPHEESAEAALTLLIIAATAALAALIVFRRPREIPSWAVVSLVALLLITTGVTIRTALLGGKIHHPETMMRPK